jgi:hypothetical protein
MHGAILSLPPPRLHGTVLSYVQQICNKFTCSLERNFNLLKGFCAYTAENTIIDISVVCSFVVHLAKLLQ